MIITVAACHQLLAIKIADTQVSKNIIIYNYNINSCMYMCTTFLSLQVYVFTSNYSTSTTKHYLL